mgnify:CR=1 FL=1
MGPDTENTPEQKADIQAAAIPSDQMWEITAKITVRADTAEEAERIVDDLLNGAEAVDSFEYVTD